jgi:hypothetical protein
MLAITYRAFEVTIDKIPIAGLSISFDNRVFAFLLVVSILYFAATFALYYRIDTLNIEKTPHETKREDHFMRARTGFWQTRATKAFRQISKKLGRDILLAQPNSLAQIFQQLNAQTTPDIIDRMTVAYAMNRVTPNGKIVREVLQRQSDKELFDKADRLLRAELHSYAARQRRHSRVISARLAGIRFLYFFRNYVVDGFLPLALAAVALLAMFHVIDLEWLRVFTPAASTR